MKHRTTVERTSDTELCVTRTIDGPPDLVFEAWTTAELFARWWVPASAGLTLRSCELDVRVGGTYRLVFEVQGSEMAFFGTYLEVAPGSRLAWTNEESGDAGAVTTVTFTGAPSPTGSGETHATQTLVVLTERYPSKEALDTAGGSTDALPEAFDQLDDLLATRRN